MGDREREIVIGVGLRRLGIAVSIGSDDFDPELVELLEICFYVG